MRLRPTSKWWTYAAALAGIVLALSLGTRGVVQSLTSPGDVRLFTNSDKYQIGDTIVFSGELAFSFRELATTTAVHLTLSGPQTISTNIPLLDGSHDLSGSPGVQGQLIVEVTFSNVSVIGVGTNVFKGLTEGAKILIQAQWTPDQQRGSAGTYRANLSADVEGATGPLTSTQAHFTIDAAPTSATSSGRSGGVGIRSATKTPTKTPTRTARPTWTSTATPTVTATVTSTSEPAVTLTATPTILPTESPSPSAVPTASPSPSPSPSATAVSTSTPSPTATSLPTTTASPTKTPTPTPTPLVLASLLTIGDTPEPALELTSLEESSGGKEEPIQGSSAGVIALIVVGLAVGSVLIAVVGIPLLRN